MPRDDMTREAAEDILELPSRYNKEELRRAYTEVARRYHPDAASRHHFDPAAAQARMVEANKAYELLKRQFTDMPARVVERGFGGISRGFAGVDWTAGIDDLGADDDPWSFAQDWSAEPATEKPGLSVRSVLLGPVVLRVVFVGLLGLAWWNNFPLLPQNLSRFVPEGAWTLADVARLVAHMVYPTYLLVYEAISGYLSGFVREVANGLVSWLTKHYVDLRPRSSSYGCALYKLLHEQVYALLLAPIVVYLAAASMAETSPILRIMLGILALVLGIDTLAACTRGGFVNVWSTALAERVEAAYLLLRARLLKRCGQWDSRRQRA